MSRIEAVIPARVWVHTKTGQQASIYGAAPGPGWEMREIGWTWRWDDGRVGIPTRRPAKTKAEAERVMREINAKFGGRRNPWVPRTDAGVLEDWARDYAKQFSAWFHRDHQNELRKFARSVARQAETPREGYYRGGDIPTKELRRVVQLLRQGLKEGQRQIREYGYIPQDKAAAKELKDEVIPTFAFLLKPKMAKNPSSDYSDEFREGAAKAVWADVYIRHVEELREDGYEDVADDLDPGPGGDWMDVLPDIPKAAYRDAEAYELELRKANNIDSIDRLVEAAARADGVNPEDLDVEDLGYYMMMPALGHGVSWEDDHEDFEMANVRWEPTVGVENVAYDMMEEAKEEYDED